MGHRNTETLPGETNQPTAMVNPGAKALIRKAQQLRAFQALPSGDQNVSDQKWAEI